MTDGEIINFVIDVSENALVSIVWIFESFENSITSIWKQLLNENGQIYSIKLGISKY